MKGFIIAFFLLLTGNILAQYTLEAVVLDGITRRPVANVNIYLNGTTIGTSTDIQGKFHIVVPEIINTSLIVSHIGYEKIIIHDPFQTLPQTLFLEEHIAGIDQVTVSAKIDMKKRSQMLELFKKEAFGDRADYCKILNENDLSLYHDLEKMEIIATAQKPLEIINDYLKYYISIDLIEFKLILSSNKPMQSDFSSEKPWWSLLQNNWESQNPLLQLPVKQFSFIATVKFTDVGGSLKTLRTRRESDYYQSSRYFFYLLGNQQIKADKKTGYFHLFNGEYEGRKTQFFDQNDVFEVSKSQDNPSMKTVVIRPAIKNEITDLAYIQVVNNFVKQPFINSLSSITFYTDTFSLDTYGNEVKKDFTHQLFLDGDFGNQNIGTLLPLDYMPEQTAKNQAKTAKEAIPDQAEERIRYYIERQTMLFPQEKIHVHTDKTFYVAGETLWFRVYTADYKTNIPSVGSRYVYGELYDPADSLIQRLKIRQDSLGVFKGYFDLPPDVAEGHYSLRFYTRYMEEAGEEYFFHQTIYIWNPFSNIHPVEEAYRNDVTSSNENIQGTENTVALPATKPNVVNLKAVQSEDSVHVEVLVSDSDPKQDSLYLLIQCRGVVCFIDRLTVSEKRSYLKEDLPSGVIQLLLLNRKLKPISESLIFNLNDDDLTQTKITPSKESYQKREPVELSIELTTHDGDPIQDVFSISVAYTTPNNYTLNSNNYTLTSNNYSLNSNNYTLTSNNYTLTSNNYTLTSNNYTLNSNNYTLYNMTDLMDGYYKKPKTLPEVTPVISGQVTYGMFQSAKTGQFVKINAAGIGHPLLPETVAEVTDNNFELSYYEYPNGTSYTLQTGPNAYRSMNPKEAVFPKKSKTPMDTYDIEPSAVESFRNYIAKALEPYRTDWKRYRDEVLTMGSQARGISPLSPGSRNDKVFTRSELEKNKKMKLEQFLASIDNITVKSDENGMYHLRYMNEGSYYDYVVIADDRLMNAYSHAIYDADFKDSGDYSLEKLLNLTLDWIEEIEIIPAPAPPISISAFGNLVVNDPELYGFHESISPISVLSLRQEMSFSHPGYMGAILITTTARNAGVNDAIRIAPLGYQVNRDFYSPVSINGVPDKRTTLYWNPEVQTDDEGRAQIRFYTSDMEADYTITIEGITKEGKMIHQTATFQVRE